MPLSRAYAARLRVAVSVSAGRLAETAGAIGSTASDPDAPRGASIVLAHELLQQTRDLLDTTVAYERARATRWQLIGRAVGVTKQSAHTRWAARTRDIDDQITIAWLLTASTPDAALAQAAETGAAPWLLGDDLALVDRAAGLLAGSPMLDDDRRPLLQVALARRTIELYAAILANPGQRPPGLHESELRELLAGARARLAELQGPPAA